MQLTFLGANRQVTGSCYHLEVAGRRIMIDCGLFQERAFAERNWDPKPVDLAGVDTLLLTHAHLDHCGLLPKLVRDGFAGRIITTRPSKDLAEVVMNDAAKIQEEDVAYKKKRHRKEGRKGKHPYVPLYTIDDAAQVPPLMHTVGFGEPVSLGDDVVVRFRPAGHILGAAMLDLAFSEHGTERRIVFSGDIGQWDVPIVGDPEYITEADYVVLESTYGDRDHERAEDVDDQLADAVNTAVARGGNVVIPTFAIERAQELMLHLAELMQAGRIPRVPTFLDSPMAVNVTEIFQHHRDFMDERMQEIIRSGRLDSAWDSIALVRSSAASRSINDRAGTSVIMAGSGMCTGGRIKHHLVHNIRRPDSIILFVGYQAEDTLGRAIVNRPDEVRIFGRMHPVRAEIRRIEGLSAHAGRVDLLRWLQHFESPPRRVFLTHGEAKTAESFAARIREDFGWKVAVPEYLDVVEL